jgi:hypothetical protein
MSPEIWFLFILLVLIVIIVGVSYSSYSAELGHSCTHDYDCRPGMGCDSGTCRALLGQSCGSLADCTTEATHCYRDVTQRDSSNAPPRRGTCVRALEAGKGIGDVGPCPPHMALDPVTGVCKATTGCVSDNDCVTGSACIDSVCMGVVLERS